MTNEKKDNKDKPEKKKNPMWDKVFEDIAMSASIDKLPKFLQFAINHERRCIKFRLKQIENYAQRINLMMAGMDYTDTFKTIRPTHGVPFPKEAYIKMRDEWEAEQEFKKKKKS